MPKTQYDFLLEETNKKKQPRASIYKNTTPVRKLSSTDAGQNQNTDVVTSDVTNTEGTAGNVSKTNYFDEQQKYINDAYNTSVDSAKSTMNYLKEEAERQALKKRGYIETQRTLMEKYLPETLRAMGLSHNGLAADAMIGMDANYSQYLLQALADEEYSKTAAERDYASAKRQADYNKSQAESALSSQKQTAWETMQQMAASGDYSEAALQNYGSSWGFDDAQMGGVLDVYKQTASDKIASRVTEAVDIGTSWNKLEMELKQEGYTEEQIATAKQYYTEHEELSIRDGQAANFSTAFEGILRSGSMKDVHSIMSEAEKLVTYGDMTAEDYKKLEQLYIARLAFDEKEITLAEYNDIVDSIKNGTYVDGKSNFAVIDAQTAIARAAELAPGWQPTDTVVNINSSDFSNDMFGLFKDAGKRGSGQDTYIERIKMDAAAGKIKEGQYIIANYGDRDSGEDMYIYVGDGCFVKAAPSADNLSVNDLISSIYTPNGYKFSYNDFKSMFYNNSNGYVGRIIKK